MYYSVATQPVIKSAKFEAFPGKWEGSIVRPFEVCSALDISLSVNGIYLKSQSYKLIIIIKETKMLETNQLIWIMIIMKHKLN